MKYLIISIICTIVLSTQLLYPCDLQAADKLPGGVTNRLKKIDENMSKVEASIAENRVNRNALDWAQNAMDEIKSQYPDSVNSTEVKAAKERIDKGRLGIEKLESDKAEAKQNEANVEKASEQQAEEWAEKLIPYKADTTENSKGSYGVPMSDPAKIAAAKPKYEEAKKVYEEFKATGIDKESHWKLRQAEYDIKVALQNYEESGNRVYDDVVKDLDESLNWIKQEQTKSKPNMISTSQVKDLSDRVVSLKLILPADSEKFKTASSKLDEIVSIQADIEKVVLKNRKMEPDVYKGKDAAKIKTLAKSIVLKKESTAKVLKIHITSSTWEVESVTEWTDTTKTALQNRTTKGLYVQVAVTEGNDSFLYTLFINRDKIGGNTGQLKGHVMYRDKFLKQNLPGK